MRAKATLKLDLGLPPVLRPLSPVDAVDAPHWTTRVPELADEFVTLREVRHSDAPSLLAMLTTPEVGRYMSPPPADVAGFEKFIAWTQAERRAGRHLCLAVVPKGSDEAVGLFQVSRIDQRTERAEWGAVLGSQFWGTGIFEASARLLFDFLFDEIGLHRLECRAAVRNGRANGAARKMGAVPEGVARQALKCQDCYHDELMWSLLADDWRQSRTVERPTVH
jgi:RimJ/RimL family protein N-acetyltransferase